MPLHPEYDAMLKQLAAVPGPALTDLPLAEARAGYRMMRPPAPDIAVGAVLDRTIPGPAGPIPVRIYSPAGSGPFPVLLNFHGGGWVIGDLDTADGVCRELCNRIGCVVMSVDYRLAPEHRFPAAVDDCFAATRWAAEHASEFNGDAKRIAVTGESAGANLAAVVCQLARDSGGPTIKFQLLAYPVTDADLDTGSYRANGEGYLLTKDGMAWFWDQYCPKHSDRTNPKAAPLRAKNFNALPAALVMTAEFDPLRDEGAAYTEKLKAAGGAAEYVCFDGLIHDFLGMSRVLSAAKPPMDKAVTALRDAFAR